MTKIMQKYQALQVTRTQQSTFMVFYNGCDTQNVITDTTTLVLPVIFQIPVIF